MDFYANNDLGFLDVPDYQAGFKAGMSCETQITNVLKMI